MLAEETQHGENPVDEKLRYRICEALGLLLPCDIDAGIGVHHNREGMRETRRVIYREAAGVLSTGLLALAIVVCTTLFFAVSFGYALSSFSKPLYILSLQEAGGVLATVCVVTYFLSSRDLTEFVKPILSDRGKTVYYSARDASIVAGFLGGIAWAIGEPNKTLCLLYGGLIAVVVAVWLIKRQKRN